MRTYNAKAAAGLLLLASGAALFCNLRVGEIANANDKTSAKPVAVMGKPIEVEIGKSISIPAQKLDVSFERVTEDSRCPQEVECVWAGQITVIVGMKKSAKKLGTTKLTVQGSHYVTPKSIGKIGNYWVKLIGVAPEKGARSSGAGQSVTLIVQSKPFSAPKNEK